MVAPVNLRVLPGTDWCRADKAALVAALRERDVQIRRLQAEQGEILAEMQSRGVPQAYGYASLEALLKDTVSCTRSDGRKRVRRALACNDYTEGSHRVPASAPTTAQAFSDGAITTAHVDSILDTLAEIPGTVPEQERSGYERILVNLARKSHPASVTKAGNRLLAWLEQDHLKSDRPLRVRPERELAWAWNRDRQLCFAGRLDAVSGALFEKLISPLAKPRPSDDGERDVRTADQRHGDAFAELLDYTQRAADLPTEAGEKPTLLVTMTLADLCGSNRTGEQPLLNGDIPASVEEARLLACDARVIPAVLGGDGDVLDLGRAQRLASTAQRRALHLRDRGCVFPSCTRPTHWTQIHHIREWVHHGATDLNNLALLCGQHHLLIHASDWSIRMAADGKPECIPPPWLDATRAPRRNRTFAPLELDTG